MYCITSGILADTNYSVNNFKYFVSNFELFYMKTDIYYNASKFKFYIFIILMCMAMFYYSNVPFFYQY